MRILKKEIIDTTTVGGRIKALRIEKGLTQEELGLEIGIENRANISAYEHDNRTVTLTVLPDLARTLGTTIDYLITGVSNNTDDIKLNKDILLAMEILRRLKTERGRIAALEHLKIVEMMELM